MWRKGDGASRLDTLEQLVATLVILAGLLRHFEFFHIWIMDGFTGTSKERKCMKRRSSRTELIVQCLPVVRGLNHYRLGAAAFPFAWLCSDAHSLYWTEGAVLLETCTTERAPWGADYVLKVLPRFGLDPLPGGPALMECADRVRGSRCRRSAGGTQ